MMSGFGSEVQLAMTAKKANAARRKASVAQAFSASGCVREKIIEERLIRG
jgi:hypothetical protein